MNTGDGLLTEIERQRKYLNQLPSEFSFPLFNAKYALESQRRSGYRDTAAAAREIVDNALEAGAGSVHVVFDTNRDAASGRRRISAIAFIDDGSGMLPDMARYALTWGGGTHFDDAHFVGKFGFGLPNSSINQTRLTEVYTRTQASDEWTKAVLDIRSVNSFGLQTIPPVEPAKLPPFVASYVERAKVDLEHGTVVIWWQPDRLTYQTPANLKEHLVDDFGVTYRYLVDRDDSRAPGSVRLTVEGVRVQPVDPLFLLDRARYHLPEDQGGSQLVEDQVLTVAFRADGGDKHLKLLTDPAEVDAVEPDATLGTIRVRVARFPYGFAEDKGRRSGESTDANRRFDIRKSRRGMSFVRARRELQTVDAFPRSQQDISSGLGEWPLLQSYAYHWGVEVQFQPELDDVFGITNDKQGVRPIEDFWRVLNEAGIDDVLRRENAWQTKERKGKKTPVAQPDDTASPAEKSAAAADVAFGNRPRVPARQTPDARQNLEQAAEERAKKEGISKDDAKAAIRRASERRRYRVDFVERANGAFYEPEWVGDQIVVWVNRLHPFYTVLYSELLRARNGIARNSIDVVLLALARAELTADEELAVIYAVQRRQAWSPYLEAALQNLAASASDDEEAEEASSAA